MPILYLVTESHRDALFYRKCAARITQKEFPEDGVVFLRNRKGDGSAAVQKQLGYALQQAMNVARGVEEVCFIAVIDNDRTPHMENSETLDRAKLSRQERCRRSRAAWIEETVYSKIGRNPAEWRLRFAYAVPVEMVESWIVKALNAALPGGPMPHFSWQSQRKTKEYYQPAEPPLQWKDLEQQARLHCGRETDEDFYDHAAIEIAAKAEDLALASESFRHFREQISGW